MDEFKISLFENEYHLNFPAYESLSDTACRQLIKVISVNYALGPENMQKELLLKQSFFEASNALGDFSLIDTLSKLKIKPLKKVFVNWGDFKSVDVFNSDDLDKYFCDIWFPASDDIDVFDEGLNWILSVRHDGCITFVMRNLN